MSTTKTAITVTIPPHTVTIPPNTDRWAYAYGWVSGCMTTVETYVKMLEKETHESTRAYIIERIMAQVKSFKAIDDALHAEIVSPKN